MTCAHQSLAIFKGKQYGLSNQFNRLSGRIRPYLVVSIPAAITFTCSAGSKGLVYHHADTDRSFGIRDYPGQLPTAT